ncbi:hypothetical protein EZV62_010360 [Acer yangbiense]|uniref:BURP domain-containing protein n=1 Tax=Acer yangbiense TaxID=1000413 RepID=A0A5C7I467_9ROSI|nr:hypothetical protein EZV62_010360 [Acer yangbiense]
MALSGLTTSLLLLVSLTIVSATTGYGYEPTPYDKLPKKDQAAASVHVPKLDLSKLIKPKHYSDYVAKPNIKKPEPVDYAHSHLPKSDLDKYKKPAEDTENYLPISIQGLVLCKSGPRYNPIPIEGAVARITCESVEKSGNYKTKVLSFLSPATNVEGYFFATLPNSILNKDKLKIKDCKVLLESSPLKTCKVPTNINKGLTGSPLHTYRLLKDKKMKLYSADTLYYTSQPAPVSNGY